MPVPSQEGALVYPDDDGTANWFSPSLDLKTGLFYQNVREKGAIQRRTREKPTYRIQDRLYMGASRLPIPGEEPWGALRALDWKTGETRWEFRVHTPPWCGVLSTAGNLVFSGTMEGDFFALDAVQRQTAVANSDRRRDLGEPDQLHERRQAVYRRVRRQQRDRFQPADDRIMLAHGFSLLYAPQSWGLCANESQDDEGGRGPVDDRTL